MQVGLDLALTRRDTPGVITFPLSKEDLVGWWKLEDLTDSGPNGYDLTGNSETFGVGKVNNALNGGTVSISDAPWMDRPNGDFSAVCWVKPSTVIGVQGIMGKAALLSEEWFLERSGTTLNVFVDPTGLGSATASIPNAFDITLWTLVALTWDNTNGVLTAYAAKDNAGSVTKVEEIDVSTPLSSGTADFGIKDTELHTSFAGLVDEASYWDRRLNDSDIDLIFNEGNGITP